jgi:hypothetical protein
METIESVPQQEILHLPAHVKRDWMARNPILHAITNAFLPSDTETGVLEQSKITNEELRTLQALKTTEQNFQTTYIEKGDPTYYQEEYASLKPTEGNPPTEASLLRSLALSLAAFKTAYPEIEVWDTQRLALLRMTRALSRQDTKGLAIDLATGMGKSSVLIPCIIPTALLTTEHVDILSLTPLSRSTNARRFLRIGDLLGIQGAEITESTSLFPRETKNEGPYTIISGGPVTQAQETALKNPVVFAIRTDIGHHVLRQTGKGGDISWIFERPAICVMDEIDHIKLENQPSSFVIAGQEEPTGEILSRYFTIPEGADKNILSQLKLGLSQEIEETRTHFDGQPQEEGVFALTLFREYERAAAELPEVDPDDKAPYKKDGAITEAGEYDIFRRIWYKSQHKTYDSKNMMPENVYDFFRSIYPSHITQALQSAINLTQDRHYFVGVTGLTVKSDRTGWPEKGREFSPLVALALYAKESLQNEGLKFPKTLHETTTKIPPTILDLLLYKKILGLTGTAVPATEIFQSVYGIDVTMIPPQFESRITEQPYEVFLSYKDKEDATLAFVREHQSDDTPFLINVPDTQIQSQLRERLDKEFPGKRIQTLSASNAEEAREVFASAGKANTISFVVLMAGREVDIPVDDAMDDHGGLHIISWEPPLDRRNERQLMGRTGRAGRKGDYVCFVSPEDRIFSLDSPQEKQRVSKILSKGNNRDIESLIRRKQHDSDDRLRREIETIQRVYEPLVEIYKQYFSLTPDVRKRVNEGWGDFLTIMETRGMFHSMEYGFSSKNPAIQKGVWNDEVRGLFAILLEVSALMPTEQIRGEFLNRVNAME